MISFRCPKCGSDYELPDEQGGQKAACPCGAKFIVPSPAQESQPPPKTTQQKKISIRSTAGQRRSTSATSSTLTAGKKGFPVRAVTIVVILAIAGFGIMKMMKHAPSPVTTETTGVTAEKITPVVIPEPPKTIASGKCSSDYSDFFDSHYLRMYFKYFVVIVFIIKVTSRSFVAEPIPLNRVFTLILIF